MQTFLVGQFHKSLYLIRGHWTKPLRGTRQRRQSREIPLLHVFDDPPESFFAFFPRPEDCARLWIDDHRECMFPTRIGLLSLVPGGWSPTRKSHHDRKAEYWELGRGPEV